MDKKFKFVYDSGYEDGMELYPMASTIKAEHMFQDGTRWQPILHQFCKFLESTGYVGVLDKIVIVDPYAIHDDSHLFKTIPVLPVVEYDEEFDLDDDDFETEDTRDDEESEEEPEMKKETA
jgi:hypothetical protein